MQGASLARSQRDTAADKAEILRRRANGGLRIFWCWRAARAISLCPKRGALQRDELEITQGYFVPQTADAITIKVFAQFRGLYLVVSALRSSVCRNLRKHGGAHERELRRTCSNFVGKQNIPTEGATLLQPRAAVAARAHAFASGRCWARTGR